ncbi:branched-chain alpha-keto acid dehydrogenase subunit E2 [Mycoplasmoides gallisepticum]|uniref:Dihydrolipoamide acetyltransferase component of pyruvate dehydrogenase complex n=1 Tax=Mycoplasmoides gallisepticum TaxID=2096 RepID=A0AB36DSS5_MYCGL|nr:dihydrolipoamide acetyltransferase family protein [Mycoplasmoides gallisepticum]OBU78883.1 branched-chain alpha-keto acid dehydrogenase subunit E2 [Mycoplasmoides gallisepticum]OBU79231.1 branched-chain alpha-keto acid dehydrogenase subunit E2 [Mycoplasmoides gallisepticum]OBU79694.1 branched-chain alpha-keto acid dehydrogenase subunit E2 [Mycoplasmoides gallisepticum]OBU80026.1 branched-chain alpha-keto acid dehydrogenase subunit E2 [Mycoplasmoides gallisepticum]OBU81035.1 branched-chain a
MFEYKFTDVGEGLHEGVVAQIYVKVGDTIKEGDPMFSVETDKVTTDLPAPEGGKVTAILASVGQTVHVGEVMLVLNGDGSSAPAAAPATPAFVAPTPVVTPAPAPTEAAPSGGGASVVGEVKVSNTLFGLFGDQRAASTLTPAPATAFAPTPVPVATPLAQAVASDLNVNLHNVTPANGAKVFSSDVFASAQQSSLAASVAANDNETYKEITSIRKAIAKAMTTAHEEIPATVLTFNFDVTKLVSYRKQVKDAVLASYNVKLSFLPFLLKAITKAVVAHPVFNSRYDKASNRLVLKKKINLGIAVDTADGLMVPNIKSAQDKSVIELAREVNNLAEKARSKKIGLADLADGTISVTNFGSIGALFGTPIIKFPEVAIIATGTIEEKLARTPENQIVIKQIMPITIAADHRWIDGADIGRFAKTLKEIVENLDGLLI